MHLWWGVSKIIMCFAAHKPAQALGTGRALGTAEVPAHRPHGCSQAFVRQEELMRLGKLLSFLLLT